MPDRPDRAGPHAEGEEPKRMKNGHEEPDLAIIAMKPANDAEEAEELVERRAGAEGNADQEHTRRTQGRDGVFQGLDWSAPRN